MASDDPWRDIVVPHASQISARRVAQATPWGLYWAVDAERHLLLILQHGGASRRSRRLPRLRGLRVEAQPADGGSDERIVIRLTDPEQRDIFLRFCRDIVDATALAQTEEQAVERFLARTWRWHRLLRGGGDTRLGDDEQRGLIGELVVLERHLLPALDALDAVRCWTGPLEAPHDFEVSRIHVEAKARGSATPRVVISSEHQLESGDAERLFLHVSEVTTATAGSEDALTVTDIATRIRVMLARRDMAAVDVFEERLGASGFDWADDYSDRSWLVGQEALYEVREGFPRITPAMVPAGVGNVRYMISLPDCEGFRVVPVSLPIVGSGGDDDG